MTASTAGACSGSHREPRGRCHGSHGCAARIATARCHPCTCGTTVVPAATRLNTPLPREHGGRRHSRSMPCMVARSELRSLARSPLAHARRSGQLRAQHRTTRWPSAMGPGTCTAPLHATSSNKNIRRAVCVTALPGGTNAHVTVPIGCVVRSNVRMRKTVRRSQHVIFRLRESRGTLQGEFTPRRKYSLIQQPPCGVSTP